MHPPRKDTPQLEGWNRRHVAVHQKQPHYGGLPSKDGAHSKGGLGLQKFWKLPPASHRRLQLDVTFPPEQTI